MRTIQNMTEEEIIAFLERIRQEVTTTPNLVRILTTTNISILNIGLYAGSRLDSEASKPFLQFLIDTNPQLFYGKKVTMVTIITLSTLYLATHKSVH